MPDVHGRYVPRQSRWIDEVGQRSPERLFPGFAEDSLEQATRARDNAGPAHLGALIAARPRILAMIRDAVAAGLLPEQPLVARLAAVVEAATTTHLQALDDEDKASANLYIQKAAQAADEAWQQTAEGHNGPTVTNPTVSEIEHSSSASQDDDDSDVKYVQPSQEATQCTAAPSAAFTLSDYTLLQGCVAASEEN